jgi:serine/threonine protein kinase
MLADRYELDHEIGRGGMGSVWLGRDTVLGRTVAIKQIGLIAGEHADLGRAEREAHLAARVTHRNVVGVYDLVEGDGHQWLVMEYVDGPTLAGLIAEQGALDPERLALLVLQVAGALAAAHAHGIVHRDVKPSNILLTQTGFAKLSDFGIARAQADAALTQTGLVTGSPAYLAPEVATGRTATIASDVWSLGATVFHAATGRPPYEVGDNLLGAMYRIVNEAAPVLEVDGPLAPLVAAMMQHDPAARPTMLEIEEALAVATVPAFGHVAEDDQDTQGFEAFGAPTQPVEPTATTAFRPLTEPVEPPRDTPRQQTSAPPVQPPTSRRAPKSGNRMPLVLGGLLAAAVVVIGYLLMSGDGDDAATDAPQASAAPSSAAPTPDAEEPVDEGGTPAEAMEGFVTDYLQTASSDPPAGFQMLTPAFQEQSGGVDGYRGFWDDVTSVDIRRVTADADALTVSYTYSYEKDGDERTDDVTLQLQPSGDTYLIAGEA